MSEGYDTSPRDATHGAVKGRDGGPQTRSTGPSRKKASRTTTKKGGRVFFIRKLPHCSGLGLEWINMVGEGEKEGYRMTCAREKT
jgi:hypothetical protein